MEFNLVSRDVKDLDQIAKKMLDAFPGYRVFAFYGKLGAGKTTFIKVLCKQLDVAGNVTSPTFSLINEYRTDKGESVYHFDLFRISKIVEVMDIGYEEFFYDGSYCCIEWPEKIENLLPDKHVKVFIEENHEDHSRTFKFKSIN